MFTRPVYLDFSLRVVKKAAVHSFKYLCTVLPACTDIAGNIIGWGVGVAILIFF